MILGDILELWNNAWPAGVTMLGLGFGFALVLLMNAVTPLIERFCKLIPAGGEPSIK